MDYRIIGLLIIIGYIVVGVFMVSLLRTLDEWDNDGAGWVIAFWPVILLIYLLLAVIVLIPSFMGEWVGNFINNLRR